MVRLWQLPSESMYRRIGFHEMHTPQFRPHISRSISLCIVYTTTSQLLPCNTMIRFVRGPAQSDATLNTVGTYLRTLSPSCTTTVLPCPPNPRTFTPTVIKQVLLQIRPLKSSFFTSHRHNFTPHLRCLRNSHLQIFAGYNYIPILFPQHGFCSLLSDKSQMRTTVAINLYCSD